MKGRDQKIKEEIGKTLEAFDNMEKIEANPFLLTKIKAGIESPETAKQTVSSLFKKRLLQPALLLLLIILNTITLTFYLQSGNDSSVRAAYVSSFAEQYSLSATNNDYYTSLLKGE